MMTFVPIPSIEEIFLEVLYKLNTTFISHRCPVQFANFCVKAILHAQAQ